MLHNYCDNELEITGAADDVAEFVTCAESDEELLSFASLLPEPDIGGLGGTKGWFNWRIVNWGSKWDALEVERSQRHRDHIVYNYQSAWAPGLNPIRVASLRWPELTFVLSYASHGGGFAGRITFRGGYTVEELAGSYEEVSAAGPDGIENDGVWRATLSDACALLAPSGAADAAAAIRQAIGEDGPRAVADVERLILSVNDPALALQYLAHPECSADAIWTLLALAVADLRGGTVLTALRASQNPRTALIGKAFTHLQASLLSPADSDEGRTNQVDEERFTCLRDALETAETAGDLEGYVETLQALSRNWSGWEIDEFLEAASRLHF